MHCTCLGGKVGIHLGGRRTKYVRLSCTPILARPDPSGSRLAHQIAQVVWTIEEFAIPLTARFSWRQLELISIHLKQIYEVGAARGFAGLIYNPAHDHLPTAEVLTVRVVSPG